MRIIPAALALGLAGCGEESSQPTAGDVAPTNGQTLSAPSEAVDSAAAVDAPSDADLQGATDEATTEASRAAMDSYTELLEQAAGVLEGVTSKVTAVSAAPEMQTLVGQLGDLRDQLGQLPDDALLALRAEFETRLADSEGLIKAQIERIAADPDLAGTLGELLDRLPLLGG